MTDKQENRILKVVAQTLSVIFFPGFLPVYGLMIIFYAPTIFSWELAVRYDGLKGTVLLLAFVNMTVVPVALMPLLRYRNIISSYTMNTRTDRIIPLAIGCLMYLLTTILFYSFHIPELIRTFVLATTILAVLVLIITTRWKISVHSAGLGSLLAIVMTLSARMHANLTLIWVIVMLLAGMVMAARLYLRSHKPAQVYSGFALGFMVIWLVMVVF